MFVILEIEKNEKIDKKINKKSSDKSCGSSNEIKIFLQLTDRPREDV